MEVKSQKRIAAEWLVITRKLLQEKLKKMKIYDTGKLHDTIRGEIVAAANGDVNKISLAFEYYGKLVDMGVGKGVKIGDVKELKTDRRLQGAKAVSKRKPRKWLGKIFMNEANQLKRILGKDAKEKVSEAMKLKKGAKITLNF